MIPILYRGSEIKLPEPLFVAFLNCPTAAVRQKFVDRLGGLGKPGSELADIALFAERLADTAAFMLTPQEHDVPRHIFLHIANRLIDGARLEPRFAEHEGNIRLISKRLTLAQFMLFEIGAALEAGAQTKRCEQCRDLFLHGPLTWRRSHAKYCSNKCRLAMQRSRKAGGE
ncbi:MAG: hypothetical protein WDM85_06725 [Caulobacteraceae bacterium]